MLAIELTSGLCCMTLLNPLLGIVSCARLCVRLLLVLISFLVQVDEATAELLSSMKEAAKSGTREAFERDYSTATFTVLGADGRPVDLLPGGAAMRVTWDTREQYLRLAESYKLREFDTQVSVPA